MHRIFFMNMNTMRENLLNDGAGVWLKYFPEEDLLLFILK